MAIRPLSSLAVGETVQIPETTGNATYIVVHQNYNENYNGAGRTLLTKSGGVVCPLTGYAEPTTYWVNQNVLYNYANTTFANSLDSDFVAKVPTTSYDAFQNSYTNIVQTSSKFFLPSISEIPASYGSYSGSYRTDYVPEANQSTHPIAGWNIILTELKNKGTVYPYNYYSALVYRSSASQYDRDDERTFALIGTLALSSSNPSWSVVPWNNLSSTTGYYYPMFTLEGNLWNVNDDGTIYKGPSPVSGFTGYPILSMQGQTVTLNWQSVSNATGYVLERSTDGGSQYTQVYSGPNTTFTETVGTWTQLKYRVQATNSDGSGPYLVGEDITVVSSASLVISGQDGSLGTIDSDIHYAVSSNTGNQITLTRLVNNVQVYTGQVSSGFTYDIPIVELPTGEGTIVINASVQTAGGLVSQSRTWTYTKAAMTFSTVGGISELDQNNQAVWPKTVMEAIRTYGFMGGTLDKTLMTLANAVIRDPDTGAFVDFEGQGIDAPQILVGSYVGTGGNTVTINTPFEPIAILLWVPAELKSGQLNIFGATPILGIKPKPNMQGGGGSKYGSAVANPYAITIPITFGDLFITMTNAEISLPSRNFGYVIFGGQVTS